MPGKKDAPTCSCRPFHRVNACPSREFGVFSGGRAHMAALVESRQLQTKRSRVGSDTPMQDQTILGSVVFGKIGHEFGHPHVQRLRQARDVEEGDVAAAAFDAADVSALARNTARAFSFAALAGSVMRRRMPGVWTAMTRSSVAPKAFAQWSRTTASGGSARLGNAAPSPRRWAAPQRPDRTSGIGVLLALQRRVRTRRILGAVGFAPGARGQDSILWVRSEKRTILLSAHE
jgi:hypothetical protein